MLSLHMIPTNGDAALLRFEEDGKEINILIDGGNRRDDCYKYLESLGIDKVDLVIASHLDEDHIRGLRRVVDEMNIGELWVTDTSSFAKTVVDSMYFFKCIYESSLLIDGRGIQKGSRIAVYDGLKKQIGPFFIEVLSPPKSLYNYLRNPDNIKRILRSPKGRSIKNYIEDEIEKNIQNENTNENSRRERQEITSEIIEHHWIEVPKMNEIKQRLESEEGTDWSELDEFYDSARSFFNDISIVVKITYDYKGIKETFLFPGDLTNWSLIMATHPEKIKRCITKVPHHGSHIHLSVQDYYKCLAANSGMMFPLKRTLHPVYYRFLKELHHFIHCHEEDILTYILLQNMLHNHLHLSAPCLLKDLDTYELYRLMSPRLSLIFPYKSSFKLPYLEVRDAVRSNSDATLCNFDQGKVSINKWRGKDACMKCYRCSEPKKPQIITWSGKIIQKYC